MTEKMDEEDLLEMLNRKEEASSHYVHGELGFARETALREYHRLPYGNEEDGWSEIVASDVQDTVQWILPALLKTFSTTDKAVMFEPTKTEDVKGAEQATDACNYVFYKQNNGFMVLHTAFTDALTVRNCAVMWRKETSEVVSSVPFKGASPEMLAMLTQDGSEIQEATPAPMMDEQGQPQLDMNGQPVMAYSGRLKKVEQKTIVKVEAFSPEDLLVQEDWNSPLLSDCPYVCRLVRTTLSDLLQMGFKDVTADELRSSDATDYSQEVGSRLANINQDGGTTGNDFGATDDHDSDDDASAEGWLRMEWVYADVDGDGIAERVCIYRLKNKILSQEVCSHVPVATFSPVLNAHRWDGMSAHDLVGDLQKLHTELLRQTLNSAYLANNPRTKVLTDAQGSPKANIDDLLDSRPGAILRQQTPDAIQEHITPFVGGATMPLLEYVQGMRENRTGVSRTSMGLNPDSLNNTATGRQLDQSAAMQRIELIARIAAETLMKPIFQGILKLLTEGGMEKLAFRLRNEFVEYDPNEWRDSYDMTINVGLGSGDTNAKAAQLMNVWQQQLAGMQFGLVTPKHLYHTAAKTIENAGFKDVQNFYQDPTTLPPAPPPPPPLEIQLKQMEQQADAQKFQAQTQQSMQIEQLKAEAKLQEVRANLELQASNDMRDSEREQMTAQVKAALEAQRIEFEKWKAELDARVKLRIAQIGKEASGDELVDAVGDAFVMQEASPIDRLAQMHAETLQGIAALAEQMARPKQIIRDATGRAQGVA
jgi:hypothetical protein